MQTMRRDAHTMTTASALDAHSGGRAADGPPASFHVIKDGRHRHSAFTIAELLIALTITSLIALTASGMLFATIRATDDRTDRRHVIVRSAVIGKRITAEVHGALSFLAASDDEIVIWATDGNANGAVNLDEIVLLERDNATSELRRYAIVWPGGWDQATIDAANTVYTPAADFSAVAAAAKGTGNFPASVWSTQLSVMGVTLDNATAQQARLATLRLALTVGDLVENVVVAASIRTPRLPAVE